MASVRKRERTQPKISDVAVRAGVSTATVSRTLAMPEKVKEATREAVLRAVRETGYVPNDAARNLRTNRTRTILAVLPDVTNVFFSRILRGISDTLTAKGYSLVIADTNNDPARERQYAAFVQAGRVDGALLLNGRMLDQLARTRGGTPIVSLCERIPGSGLPHVETANRKAARAMTAYLISLGHRRIGYVRGPATNILEAERFAGYRDALKASGLQVDSTLIQPGDFTITAGEVAAQAYLDNGALPDAVFACNDAMAMGLLRVFAASGLRVPEQISVAGFDDIEFAEAYNPALTTVRQARSDIGARAAGLLIDLIEGRELPEREIQLDAEMILRESTAPRAISNSTARADGSRARRTPRAPTG
jgi:LacI family transcriptional regulator, repressor for deo operon, udp, cdd, tsx, nupC, and nupG